MKYPKVSIIVLTWNHKEDLDTCLNSLRKLNYPNYEVIVVDNGSTDGAQELVKKKYKFAKLIENNENLGFAKANNIGIDAAKGDYILTLNNDTKMDKNCIKELMIAAQKNPEAGMFSCKMIFFNNRKKINSIGLKLYTDGAAFDAGFNEPLNKYNTIQEVFGPCGGAAFFSKKALQYAKLNNDYYDSDFFIYAEDLDLSFRIRLLGYKCYYVPKAIVYHKFQATCGKMSDFGIYHGIKNKVFFLIKCYPSRLLFRYSIPIILRQFISIAYYLIHFNKVAIKSRLMILKLLPLMLKKRKIIQRNKKISYKEIKSWLTPRKLSEAIFYKA